MLRQRSRSNFRGRPLVSFYILNDFLSGFRFVKFSMPSIPDFETLFSQVQLFISTCNGEHIRYATDTCKFNFNLSCSYISSKVDVCMFMIFCLFFSFTVFLVISSCWPLPPVNKCPCGKKTGKQILSSNNKLAVIRGLQGDADSLVKNLTC